LQRADAQLERDFKQTAFFARIPAGRDVFVEGDRVDGIALLISGVVRVYKIGETGREITLYRFGLGQSCIPDRQRDPESAVVPRHRHVEQAAEAVMIPADAFRDWVRRYDLWRELSSTCSRKRLASVRAIVEEVAFGRMDRRVAAFLLDRAQIGNSDAHHASGDRGGTG